LPPRNPEDTPSDELLRQIIDVEPSSDGKMHYRPCRIVLRDGRDRDFVYVQETHEYVRYWKASQEVEERKEFIALDEVEVVEESPSRLPVDIANRIYSAGETGMGYFVFYLALSDGSEVPCLTGGAVDFLKLPADVSLDKVGDVRMGEKKLRRPRDAYAPTERYAWCLYSLPDRGLWPRIKRRILLSR